MKNEVIALVLILVIIGSAGMGYLVGINRQRTLTSTRTIFERPFTFYSPVSSSGLQLQVWLNTTTVRQNGDLTAQIYLTNTLPRNISLSTAYSNTNISTWDSADFLCGNNLLWGTVGFALFKGHFTSANISSSGHQLILTPPIAVPCAIWPTPISIVLYPHSDKAVAYYNASIRQAPVMQKAQVNAATESCVNQPGGGSYCGNVGTTLFGYWDYSNQTAPYLDTTNATISSPYFHYFSPGQYTLVAEDLWNQTVYAYFWAGLN